MHYYSFKFRVSQFGAFKKKKDKFEIYITNLFFNISYYFLKIIHDTLKLYLISNIIQLSLIFIDNRFGLDFHTQNDSICLYIKMGLILLKANWATLRAQFERNDGRLDVHDQSRLTSLLVLSIHESGKQNEPTFLKVLPNIASRSKRTLTDWLAPTQCQ